MEQKRGDGVAAVIIFFALLFVFTKWGPAINFSSVTQTKDQPFVVTGEGKVYVTPDIAKISLGIKEMGVSLKEVQDSVNKKSQTLTSAVKKMGVKEEDIKTTSYNLYPEYNYQTSVTKIIGYRVSTTYQVTIRDFDKINSIIVAATDAGANMEGSISFNLNDDTRKDKLNEARKLAISEAKTKAEGLASAAGITLGRIINIGENENGSNCIYDLVVPSAESAIGKLATEPAIEAGQTTISVVVDLSYEVR
jgi:uncharacterized protein YggE